MSHEGPRCLSLFNDAVEKRRAFPQSSAPSSPTSSECGQGGSRGIGLFPSVYRVWAKARLGDEARWDTSHPLEESTFRKGRRPCGNSMAACVGSTEGQRRARGSLGMGPFW
eukprot:15480581-Alexandrium_andersonii.AAC.1